MKIVRKTFVSPLLALDLILRDLSARKCLGGMLLMHYVKFGFETPHFADRNINIGILMHLDQLDKWRSHSTKKTDILLKTAQIALIHPHTSLHLLKRLKASCSSRNQHVLPKRRIRAKYSFLHCS